ncbi:MAG: [FeFe] hydrogenase H-cluster maturation GTPase HydF [Dethiobacter sp.]|jgi:[FeFe] hydrogenase H-cluster maturation GTPase HydF|nr:[FeFe] hydrogenase H-cluster maturation GTPase HydF [Dethiobacter sp.]MBS3899393.1 [FeFe] hydrogenase H-cluster maturation GTPase HydF [Dethiobacter sp.]MBS3983466.1 [FeFe] hydrogenase H-cluster maturation GTPase HydF [Dethiobacter sp.]MCL4463836.1 [FeFe] hydrogenase H-cluster maturation GTPase HydF [Bacillota bacterium]MCL5993454.1 [FeFe] hydrogenase H-cluster maturation GTPase HydF [Bacillota bacterium]
MQNTPQGSRLHIAIFGRRNAGKSSLINALTNQDIALVSAVPGTTTDPVYKAMEILPIGPVVLIDTAGIDDEGELGALRVKRAHAVLKKADMVLLVMDVAKQVSLHEERIAALCREKGVPLVGVLNKSDLNLAVEEQSKQFAEKLGLTPVVVSAATGTGLLELKLAIIGAAPATWDERTIVGDLLQPGDLAVLLVPIDLAAPKGRLILPQVQTMRDILDHHALSLVVMEGELKEALAQFVRNPKIVITDSQAFLNAAAETPPTVLLTSFSILFARYKGDLAALVRGAKAMASLRPGDKVLLAEACTHHRVEGDIGRVKIPAMLRQAVGGELEFSWSSGQGFPENLSEYRLVIHCGGCMINRREMLARIAQAQEAGVPIVNYGVAIAQLMGILSRALSPFPEVRQLLEEKNDTKGLISHGG